MISDRYTYKFILASALCGFFFAGLAADANAQVKEQQNCINTINKSAQKVAATQGKANSGCVKDFGLAKLPLGQTAQQCLTADNKGKVAKATGKTVTLEGKKCVSPLPTFGYTNAATANQAAIDEELGLVNDIFGNPLEGGLVTKAADSDGASCQAAVIKATEKLSSTIGKTFNKCKKDALKNGTTQAGLEACQGPDPKGKNDKAATKLTDTIVKKCVAPYDPYFPGDCSAEAAAGSTELGDCLEREAKCHICTFLNTTDDMESPCDTLDDGLLNATCRECGNGAIEAPEDCDDSGESPTCDADCTTAACGDGTTNAAAGEDCDDSGESATCDADCSDAICGDGTTNATAGEDCDDSGESATCDADCTDATCGDGTTNATAGETCDDAGESATCDADCTVAVCGDGTHNPTSGEGCDDGGANSDVTPDACRTNCQPASCGDGVIDSGETCDDSGESATCDADCTVAVCGDGTTNAAAGEACDDAGESATCDADCSAAVCGDGTLNTTSGEGCDDGGANSDVTPDACRTNCQPAGCGDSVIDSGEFCDDGGNTPTCDADCTAAACGDGFTNPAASEDCDDSGESATCDADCSDAICGDDTLNVTSGEECDDGNTTPGDGCNASCLCGPGSGEAGCQDQECPASGQVVIYAGTGITPCTGNIDCAVGTCNTGLGLCQTETELSTGWTGIAHGSDANDQVKQRAKLVCPGPFDSMSAEPCGECEVTGLIADTRDCRCENDNRAVCDEPFVADADDCGGDICNCYLGAPLPLSAGNTPACSVNQFAVDVTGTANVDLGAGEVTTALKAIAHLGINLVLPCPACGGTCTAPFGCETVVFVAKEDPCTTNADCDNLEPGVGECTALECSTVGAFVDVGDPCVVNADCDNADPGLGVCTPEAGSVGDPCATDISCDSSAGSFDGVCENYDGTAKDGVRDGTCAGGLNDGESCDIDAYNSTFPAPGLEGAGQSLDCFPDPGKNVSGTGLNITLTQTTGTASLPPASVECGFPPFVTYDCPCGQCLGDTAIPCSSDAECGVDGPCVSDGGGKPLPDQCTTTENCIDIGGGKGECGVGPIDRLCDGIVRADGGGFISCLINADCTTETIGLVAGACTLAKKRECFLDPVTATGAPDPETPIGAAAFCIPKTSNGGINTVAGLPGPARIRNQVAGKTFCASDPLTQYTPGVGGCP